MRVNEILEPIPSIDTNMVIKNTISRLEKYPKNSISKREVVESIDLGNISTEEAQKICDELNQTVTMAIFKFLNKLKSK